MTILNAEQYFNLSMNQYPTLYCSSSLEYSKLKVFDQLFNVIGNGYHDIEDFINKNKLNSYSTELINSFPQKYVSNEPLYNVYTELDSQSSRFKVPNFDSMLNGIFTEEEVKQFPDSYLNIQINNHSILGEEFDDITFVPYPNFNKQYSILWDDISSLNKSWIEAGIFYYTKAQEFFNSENTHLYHDSIPAEDDVIAWNKLINEFETTFKNHFDNTDNTESMYEKISKDYELEYVGDTKDFIIRRWNKELSRIQNFISETLVRLNNNLTTLK